MLAGCAAPSPPPDTPHARLAASWAVFQAFPEAGIESQCAARLRAFATTAQQVKDIQRSGRPLDPVSGDVLESDTRQAASACEGDVRRLCAAAVTPESLAACGAYRRLPPQRRQFTSG